MNQRKIPEDIGRGEKGPQKGQTQISASFLEAKSVLFDVPRGGCQASARQQGCPGCNFAGKGSVYNSKGGSHRRLKWGCACSAYFFVVPTSLKCLLLSPLRVANEVEEAEVVLCTAPEAIDLILVEVARRDARLDSEEANGLEGFPQNPRCIVGLARWHGTDACQGQRQRQHFMPLFSFRYL